MAPSFLHYVLDLWIKQWREKHAKGDVVVIRYADDVVFGFTERINAERFLASLHERFAKFGLALHPEKTRLIEFGRFASERRRERGDGEPSCVPPSPLMHPLYREFERLCSGVAGPFIDPHKAARADRVSDKVYGNDFGRVKNFSTSRSRLDSLLRLTDARKFNTTPE